MPTYEVDMLPSHMLSILAIILLIFTCFRILYPHRMHSYTVLENSYDSVNRAQDWYTKAQNSLLLMRFESFWKVAAKDAKHHHYFCQLLCGQIQQMIVTEET